MENRKYYFTSESVSEGHPDKLCDQISDAVLDKCLEKDSESRVACETYAATGMVLVGGEITTEAFVNIQETVRALVKKIGYTKAEYGLDSESMAVMNIINSQSPDISQGVSTGQGLFKEQGAGDQGMMFGFACNETKELMPAPIMYSHKLLQKAAEIRHSGEIAWLRPDSKSQVTIEYEEGVPRRIDAVVISHQHNPDVEHDEIKETLISKVVKPILEPTGLIDSATKYYINPTGRFVIGGPFGDTGLTGRKIIVDTYGGMGRHGGGAFSGKDPSKVDRSAAYMGRYIAKNIVAAELCTKCEVELSYAIGVPFPISVMVDTFGTGKVPETRIEEAVKSVFDLTPAGIIRDLDLKKPIYLDTATYGHFGNNKYTWEKTDKITELQNAVG
ncbi:MAG: methionine adenosyltransferase [Spirochaetaceae bacterium]|nr:methionine adenosyltransferase [Spirochaetaceae bacterium]